MMQRNCIYYIYVEKINFTIIVKYILHKTSSSVSYEIQIPCIISSLSHIQACYVPY